MKYYSEKLKKVYDSVEELEKAEKELQERELVEKAKREERTARAKEVDEAYQKYQKLLREFIKDYGAYHYSNKGDDVTLFDILFGNRLF